MAGPVTSTLGRQREDHEFKTSLLILCLNKRGVAGDAGSQVKHLPSIYPALSLTSSDTNVTIKVVLGTVMKKPSIKPSMRSF